MLNTILIDSGPLIALFDRDDFYHNQIIDFIKNKKYKFISTIAVLTEVTHMLDFNINVQLSFLQWVMNEGLIIQEILKSKGVTLTEEELIEIAKNFRSDFNQEEVEEGKMKKVKLETDWVDCFSNEEAKCPFCGAELSNSWELEDEDVVEDCDCGNEYDVYREVKVTYTTRPKGLPPYKDWKKGEVVELSIE